MAIRSMQKSSIVKSVQEYLFSTDYRGGSIVIKYYVILMLRSICLLFCSTRPTV